MFGTKKDRKTPFKREVDVDLEDIRDDTVALFLNSGLSFEDIHRAGGPTGQTISKWIYKTTRFPRMSTIRATLRAVGGEIVVVSDKVAGQLQARMISNRLGVPEDTPREMDQTAHKARQLASKHRTHRHRNRSAHRRSANGS